jgi:hypothetical protein
VRGLSIGYFGQHGRGGGAGRGGRTGIESARSFRVVAGPIWRESVARGKAATLLIVGGHDTPVIELNEQGTRRCVAKAADHRSRCDALSKSRELSGRSSRSGMALERLSSKTIQP